MPATPKGVGRDLGREIADNHHAMSGEAIKAARDNRHGVRDATMILIAFRHGLPGVQSFAACNGATWNSRPTTLHVRRAKGGDSATHLLLGDETRALRALKREARSPFVFAV